MSPDGQVQLAFDAGTLKLTHALTVLWTPPVEAAAESLLLEGDGVLSLWSKTGRIWSTDGRTPGTDLRVQDDGNLVLYDNGRPVWALR